MQEFGNMENNLLVSALKYTQMGFSVIPIFAGDKKPSYIKWEPYQKEKATTEQIKEWWSKWPQANIGIVTGEISDLCIIDADSKEAIERIEQILPDNTICPIASTPRGGRHYYFRYTNGLTNKANVFEKIDVRTKGGYIVAAPSRNNGSGQYEWLVEVESFNLFQMPSNLLSFLIKGGMGGENLNSPALATSDHTDHKRPQLFIEGRRDEDLFHVANCLIKGGCEIEIASQVLNILGDNCSPKFPEKEIAEKIKSVLKRTGSQSRNISAEVREWILATNGHTTTTNCHKELGLTTNDHKKAANMCFARLRAEGVIEKYGEMNGCYRLIPKDENDDMEFVEEEIFEYPVKLPFGLNDIVSLYPKNIVIIAGSKSAGKTAILLDLAIRNQKDKEVVYLNSEMGPVEWSKRMKSFGCNFKSDIKFKAKKCSANFHDKIDGSDKIFIVDFLEIHENFFEIAKFIRLIHEKLEKGICFVAVQKKWGERLGRGADFSMEKARLYLNLEFEQERLCTKVTIIDAKANKLNMDARGLNKKIKIIGGSSIQILDREWMRS
jgi:hypothetical protein